MLIQSCYINIFWGKVTKAYWMDCWGTTQGIYSCSYLYNWHQFLFSAAAQLSGPIEFVTAYTGRGFRLLLRGLDKFLTLYDGLTELQPLSTVLCVPLIFQAASFSQCFVSSSFFAQECKLNLMEQHIDYSFMDLWLCFYSSPERGEYGTRWFKGSIEEFKVKQRSCVSKRKQPSTCGGSMVDTCSIHPPLCGMLATLFLALSFFQVCKV